MTNGPVDYELPIAGGDEPLREVFDPAGQMLADALRKSFRVLKALMLVLVVMYLLSGLFSVKPGEAAVVVRFGKLVTEAGKPKIYTEGWNWSWPFPIDRSEIVPIKERELDVKFMFAVTEEERATGKLGAKYNPLAPERDDYLVTGDVNILHSELKIKYRISGVVDYVMHLHPMADTTATVRSAANKPYLNYPEYTLLRNMARDAVIETAAGLPALDIRGSGQNEFLRSVSSGLNRRLEALAERGSPLGIDVDLGGGVIAPKGETGGLEAILPPRQVQEVFDRVSATENQKHKVIKQARGEAHAMLVETAGGGYPELAKAVQEEFDLIRRLSAAESNAGGASDAKESIEAVRAKLEHQREETEALLKSATGYVRVVLNNAEIQSGRILKGAAADYDRFISVLPEYKRNPGIFMSRLRKEMRTRALSNEKVRKIYLDPNVENWLRIESDTRLPGEEEEEQDKPGTSSSDAFLPTAPTIRMPSK